MRKILFFTIALALCACGGGTKKKVATVGGDASTEVTYSIEDEYVDDMPVDDSPVSVDMHNAQNSLDYQGKYTGTLPAADCPGIQTTLTLRNDGQFVLNEKFIDSGTNSSTTGKYIVKGNLLTLGISEVLGYYKIEEGRLRRLDSEKKVVNGKLAGHYVLRKVE